MFSVLGKVGKLEEQAQKEVEACYRIAVLGLEVVVESSEAVEAGPVVLVAEGALGAPEE